MSCSESSLLSSNSSSSPIQVNAELQKTWEKEQDTLREKMITDDSKLGFNWPPSEENSASNLRLIGGVDISFFGDSDQHGESACAALIVMEFPSFKVVYETYRVVRLTQPYISGFLAFREVPAIVSLFEELRVTHPELVPQVIMVDGNGELHGRGFGFASHLGVTLDIPTIGVAKTLLLVDGLNQKAVLDECHRRLLAGGDRMDLVGVSGRIWGKALRSTNESHNPIYVSVGHRISIATATSIVHMSCAHRIPEPIRHADLGSREQIRMYQQGVGHTKA